MPVESFAPAPNCLEVGLNYALNLPIPLTRLTVMKVLTYGAIGLGAAYAIAWAAGKVKDKIKNVLAW